MGMIQAAHRVLNNSAIPHDQVVAARFYEATEVLATVHDDADSDFDDDDIPDEYIDPIMGTLMRNPVRLPTSEQVVDRATIARQLVAQQIDPFNRQPLTLDQVVPVPELKGEIERWIKEKRNKPDKLDDEMQVDEAD